MIINFRIEFTAFLLIFVLGNCHLNRIPNSSDEVIVNLIKEEYILFRSGGCIGPCDSDELIISKSGLSNLNHKPLYGKTIHLYMILNNDTNEALWDEIQQVDWNSIQNRYGIDVEDMSIKSLIIFTKDLEKEILYKHGEPSSLVEIENLMLRIIKYDSWIELEGQ